ncbi:protein IQ-DOMAIN 14-like [Durio zibethinus]|uniref:Protein IQ-DOMAIN 14-like n=1 Tax=Durio zibethinus TaxID=66656 RepID=A0A6P6AHW0_DURZI|nr:protein IQ-DOMAIN 14-like [Durio zibethinus]XP_022764444.1 protein IQ-DOMAIN 14-like [Durio zibethinus]
MAKKKSWFNLVKRFFLFETLSKTEKKEKRRKWMFGRFRTKRLASLTAPSPPRDRTKSETEEEQDKHALTVAIATAAAAEAAVAAARVAAQVVRLTGTPQSDHKCEGETEERTAGVQPDSSSSNEQERKIQELAATKIQATFRGYLARKALRALKGIVRLQAIIRGWAVRRQAMTTLKCLQSVVNIQSQVCARRFQMAEGTWQYDENKQLLTLKDKIIKVDINSQRRWDDSILTKEEADAMVLSRKEAAMKREKIKEYSYVHRKSAESEQNKGNGRLKYWLDEWVDTQVTKSKEVEDLDSVRTPNRRPTEEDRAKQLRLKTFPRRCHYHLEGLDSPAPVPRRSFHKKQCSLGEDNSFSTSPIVPTYMATTQSAKAKVRSMSSPKLRTGSFDTQSESNSPYKNKLSLISSLTRELPSSCRISSRSSAYQQRSPSLKGVPGPVKSKQTLKDLSFNSECSLPNWVRKSSFP